MVAEDAEDASSSCRTRPVATKALGELGALRGDAGGG